MNLHCACRNRTARGIDRAQELSRHIRIAKQQPPIVMAALLNHLFSAQVGLPSKEGAVRVNQFPVDIRNLLVASNAVTSLRLMDHCPVGCYNAPSLIATSGHHTAGIGLPCLRAVLLAFVSSKETCHELIQDLTVEWLACRIG